MKIALAFLELAPAPLKLEKDLKKSKSKNPTSIT